MAFKEINVGEIIEQEKQNAEFAEEWDKSRMEYEIIGQIIKLRKQQSLSQSELAEKIQRTQQTVSRVENKDVSPSLRLVCEMVEALGFDLKVVPRM